MLKSSVVTICDPIMYIVWQEELGMCQMFQVVGTFTHKILQNIFTLCRMNIHSSLMYAKESLALCQHYTDLHMQHVTLLLISVVTSYHRGLMHVNLNLFPLPILYI